MSDVIFRVIGKKWTLPIIQKLIEIKELRFNELKNQLEEITPSNLSITLKDLEKNNVISKKLYDLDSQAFSYRLTNYGKFIFHTSNLISIVGKLSPELSNKSNIIQISEKIFQEIQQLESLKKINDNEIKNLSKTIESLIKNEINNMRTSITKFLIPIGSLCGVLTLFCISHGMEHLEHVNHVL